MRNDDVMKDETWEGKFDIGYCKKSQLWDIMLQMW